MADELIYLDNAASTRLDERVLEAMRPYYFDKYAVATSQFGYSLGLEAREALEAARGTIADALGADADEIVFTSGATESSNMAIKGVAERLPKDRKRIITTPIEDFAVLHSVRHLEKLGFQVDYAAVDEHGRVDLDRLADQLDDDVGLVSVQAANQEIGTLQELERIAALCHERGVLLHSDATHAFPRVPLNMGEMLVDLLTVSAHLIHGPQGVGALYVRQDTPIQKWMDGGYQEFNRRGGVENIPGAVGFAKAVELVTPDETARLKDLRDRLTEGLLGIEYSRLNGHPKLRLPHNSNISFRFIEGESLLLHLDMRGFTVSTGSACFSRSLEGSHVILGIGGDHERAHGSVRFTFGRFNSEQEIESVVRAVQEVVERLRAISPLGKASAT